MSKNNWRIYANCKGQTELFFPPDNERPPARARRVALALSLCAECEVSEQCREARGDNLGIWGGEV